jgi:uncharacterized protein YqgC (DUF456 family)
MKYLFSNTTKWIWITGVAGIIILPLIFKIPFSSFCSNYFDYTQTGQIGDTIGGITGPFINLLAAVLVYLAFKAQIDANKLNEEQHSFNYLVDQINRLEDIVLNSSIFE